LSRLVPLLHLAQQRDLGHHLAARILRAALGHLADECARLVDLSLACQQRCAPHLHLDGLFGVVDPGQPRLGTGQVVLLLGRLGEHQPGLGEPLRKRGGERGRAWRVVVRRRGRVGLGERHVAQQGRCGELRLVQFDVQRTEREPGGCSVGRARGHGLHLRQRVDVTLQAGEHPCIEGPHGVALRRGLQMGNDDFFGLRRLLHQFEREQCRRLARRIECVGVAREREGTRHVGCRKPCPSFGHHHRRPCGRGVAVGLKHLLNERGRGDAVRVAREEPRHVGDQRVALGIRCELDERLQGRDRVGQAIHRHQQLHQETMCLGRLRHSTAPGLHRGECLLAGACL